MRVVDDEYQYIDYRLHLLGIRVAVSECRLIARGDGHWEPMGPICPLPIEFPSGPEIITTASTDTLRLTAWQYDREYPGTDLRLVLAQRKHFVAALKEHS